MLAKYLLAQLYYLKTIWVKGSANITSRQGCLIRRLVEKSECNFWIKSMANQNNSSSSGNVDKYY